MGINASHRDNLNDKCPASNGAIGTAFYEAQLLPLPLCFQGTLGHDVGPGSDGVLFGTLTDQDVTAAVADDGGSMTDETTEANESTDDDMTLLPATPAEDDAYYFGHDELFSTIVVGLSTSGNGTWTITWEYYDEDEEDWQTLDVEDESSGFTNGTGKKLISFAPPTDWGKTEVNSTEAYWVRARVSAYTSVVTAPAGDQCWVLDLTHGSGLRMLQSGEITGVSMTADTASGTSDDSEFVIVNVTQGTYEAFTWTGGDVMDRVGDLSLAFNVGDEIVLQQVVEDGSTEFAGVNFVFEVQYT